MCSLCFRCVIAPAEVAFELREGPDVEPRDAGQFSAPDTTNAPIEGREVIAESLPGAGLVPPTTIEEGVLTSASTEPRGSATVSSVRKVAALLVPLCLAAVLIGAGAGSSTVPGDAAYGRSADSGSTPVAASKQSATSSGNGLVSVSGVVSGDASTNRPSPTPHKTPIVAGETATPHPTTTPPPTSEAGGLSGIAGNSTPILALLIGFLFGGLVVAVAERRRRDARR